jgi:NAD(P)-dependent dehydrogenase (short-subunit alcohol dehydrogenase family)
MDSFAGKLAVVTGGGSGMGRELVRQLAAQGCSVATCDWHADEVAETVASAQADAPAGVRVTSHVADVAQEPELLRFRDELLAAHTSDHVDLVFANAAFGGGGSFVTSDRGEWERTFAAVWQSVYYSARVFLPLLIASGDGVLVNTSSLNGLWATLGPGMPNNAYSTGKFAVRGFTEALIEDLRINAPQVRVAVVLPGHVGTNIMANSRRAHGGLGPERMTGRELADARTALTAVGLVPEGAPDDAVRQALAQVENDFRDKAPLSAAGAATIILDQVKAGAWRILVGQDAELIDASVRAHPEAAYDYETLFTDVGERAKQAGTPAE